MLLLKVHGSGWDALQSQQVRQRKESSWRCSNPPALLLDCCKLLILMICFACFIIAIISVCDVNLLKKKGDIQVLVDTGIKLNKNLEHATALLNEQNVDSINQIETVCSVTRNACNSLPIIKYPMLLNVCNSFNVGFLAQACDNPEVTVRR